MGAEKKVFFWGEAFSLIVQSHIRTSNTTENALCIGVPSSWPIRAVLKFELIEEVSIELKWSKKVS